MSDGNGRGPDPTKSPGMAPPEGAASTSAEDKLEPVPAPPPLEQTSELPTEVPGWRGQVPFFLDGLDFSSAFPLALTRRVIRRGLRTTRRGRGEVLGRGAILITVSALSAVLLGPRLVDMDLPTDPALVGSAARGRVVADRDYEIVLDEETERRRKKASRLSRSVWDLDNARKQAEVRLLRAQLGRVNAWLAPRRGTGAGALRPTGVDPVASPNENGQPAFGVEMLPALVEEAATLRASVAGELELAAIEAPRDEAWRALLIAAFFDVGATETVVSAVDEALGREIVGERVLLEREEARGITVRQIGTGPAAERIVTDVASIPDIATRRAQLTTTLIQELSAQPTSLPAPEAEALATWAASLLRTTLTYNAAETEERRQKAMNDIPPVVQRIRRGETVLAAGELMTQRHLLVLRSMAIQQGDRMQTRAALGTGAFVLLLCSVVYFFGSRGVFRRRLSTRDLLFVSTVLLLFLLLVVAAEWGIAPLREQLPEVPRSVLFYGIPVAWAAMQARFVLSAEIAFLLALVAALLGGVTTEPGMAWTVTALLASLAGTAGVQRVRSRFQLLFAGLAAGVVGAGAAITLELFRGTLVGQELAWLGGATLVSGLLSGVLVIALTSLFEAAFGYVTDLKLLALSDLNSPLLKELILRAPGTWHHSMRVATLSETAAAAIGANALLARVMSLYHDVGKVKDPGHFSENQSGDNPHDRLAPAESAAILRAHVDHGKQLAARHRLPRAVAAAIEEHHGDSVIEHFYRKALTQVMDAGDHGQIEPLVEPEDDQPDSDHDDHDEDALEGEGDGTPSEEASDEGAEPFDDALYRYGGRWPRTRESALVMLADQMEAASRSLEDPTEELVRKVADHFVNRAVIGGALAECDLSMREVEVARETFAQTLADLVLHQSQAEADLDAPGL